MIARGPIPLAELREDLRSYYAPPRRSPRTWPKVRRALDELARVGVATTADLTAETVLAVLGTRPAREGPATTRALAAYLRVICRFAADDGCGPPSPFFVRPVILPRTTSPDAPTLAAPSIAAALALMRREAADSWPAHRLYALAATVALCGLRTGEALDLTVDHADTRRGLFSVAERKWGDTPAGARPVPMPPPLIDDLRRWLPARAGRRADSRFLFPSMRRLGPWKGGAAVGTPTEQLAAAGRRAGIEGLTMIMLRRSWARLALTSWGIPPAIAAAILGTAHPRDRRRVDVAELARHAARIRFDGGGGP